MKKYLIFGDLAAHFDQFLSLVSTMTKDTIIIVLGDVPDRGSQAKELIQYLINHPQIIWIMGNHEHMMVQCYNHIVHKKEISALYNLPYWIYVNGGDATLKSYGIKVEYLIKDDPRATRQFIKQCSWSEVYNVSVSDTMERIYNQFDLIPKEHIDYMEKLPLVWEDDVFIATHAPVNDWNDKEFFNLKNIESDHSEYNVLWNRNLNYSKIRQDNKIHVYGHCNLDVIFAQAEDSIGGQLIDMNKLIVPEKLVSLCLDASKTGNILAYEYPLNKIHKIKMK